VLPDLADLPGMDALADLPDPDRAADLAAPLPSGAAPFRPEPA
jgi:hypothetical protein